MKRIAAYCRVSTEKEDQANSFESQQRYFKECIEKRSDWILYAIYTDEGISGTNTQKRKGFNQMIADARNGHFDYILTKEVSRFARNTVDTLQYTRELKQLGIGVHFTIDQIDTLSPDAELRLTIMASLAQEESRKTSERVKWGQKRRMEQGVVFGRDLLGYHVHQGKLYLNEAEALIVRMIFHKFVEEGKSASLIAHELKKEKIPVPSHMTNWSSTSILRILQNEKYCGDLVQKKTFTPDYLSHKKKYNHGEEELVILHNHHIPIISRQQFINAKQELKRRNPDKPYRYSRKYCLSGKIFCGSCDSHFVSRTQHRKNGDTYCAWRCYTATTTSQKKQLISSEALSHPFGCRCAVSSQIPNHIFFDMLQQIFYQLSFIFSDILSELEGIIASSFTCKATIHLENSFKQRQKHLIEKQERLLELLAEGILAKEDYLLVNEKYRHEKIQLEETFAQKDISSPSLPVEKQISDSINYLKSILTSPIPDETFYQHMIHKIIVYNLNDIEIFLYGLPKPWVFQIIVDE